jgi:hypothetical protein
MLPEFLKPMLALFVAFALATLSVAWGYASIDGSFRPLSSIERLTPLLLASVFACSLVLTAMRFVWPGDDSME